MNVRTASSKNFGDLIPEQILLFASPAIAMGTRTNANITRKWTKMASLWTFMEIMKEVGSAKNVSTTLKASIVRLASMDFSDLLECYPMPPTHASVINFNSDSNDIGTCTQQRECEA